MKTRMLFCILLFVSACLYSTIINVPADQPTIQAGIDVAADTDTVLVADGTYFENINFIGKAITVASNFLINADTLHIENTIINGSQPDDPDYGSCARFMSGEDTTSVITGFTLTGGTGTYFGTESWGGGIECLNSSAKIVSNIIMNNIAFWGGGVECYNSSAILLNNVISYNTAIENIGGLFISYSSNAYVEGNIISNNTATAVGGILINISSPKLVNNIICNNTAETVAGGLDVIYSPGTDRTTIENCQIYGNTSGSYSGGIQIYNANVDLINCTINDNHSGLYGGGIGIFEISDVNLSYTSIYGNSASSDGGGIEILSSTIIITNCTIYGNEAPGCGSQIDCWSGELEAVNSFIGGNSVNGSVYFNTAAPTFDYCDFYNSEGNDFDGPSVPATLGVITTVNNNGDPCDEFMNILLDPLFVDPANNDFHLTEFSPCIDAGDPDSPPDPDGSIVDIGRYFFFNADFEADLTTGLAPLTVQFTDLSIGNPTSWEWDFENDGTINSNEQNPEWTFEEAGTYSVSLTIGDGINQNTEVKIDYIVVDPVSAQGEIVTLKTELKGNYPNPFNPSTTISFSLTAKDAKSAKLEICNLKGQKIRQFSIFNSQSSITWDGTDQTNKPVSSGIYFYKLKTGNFEKTRKMILMK